MRAPDLAELETLVACAAEGSLVAAAERLQISRPAVAKRIRNLETLAGRALLHRGRRGVRLTDAGATLLAGARRMLDERDALIGLLSEIRGEGPSAIAGLRELLGHSPQASRAAQQAEARLTETEHVLELVLRASATGVAISDAETSVLHEVNEAFCSFVGRPRDELVGKPATESGTWYDVGERPALVDELRRTGGLERVLVRVTRPDGTIRVGKTSASLVSLAGSARILSTIDDVTEERRAGLERNGALIAYRAITQVAAEMLAGRPPFAQIVAALPELRRSGGFATVLLWGLDAARPVQVIGDEPWPALGHELAHAQRLTGADVEVLRPDGPTADARSGFVVPLPSIGHSLVLLSSRPFAPSAQTLIASALTDLAMIVAATPAMTLSYEGEEARG
jgi:PAS domain S-box-containing protein